LALAFVQYPGNGTNRLFSVSFPYILRIHVKVFLNYDVVTGIGTELVDGPGFSWLSDTQIQTTAAPALGATVTIIRRTPSGVQLVVYAAGSPPTPTDLNAADLQALYAIQEQADLTAATAALAASSAVAVTSALPYQPVASVANIPAPPINGQRIEISNSTGIQSFSPLTGRPSAFIGASNLFVRLVYTTTGNTWQWVDYRVADPDSRYTTKAETDQNSATIVTALADKPGFAETWTRLQADTRYTTKAETDQNSATIVTALADKPGFAEIWTRLQADTRYLYFAQPGIGAVNRTIESKLRETVSLLDYGVVGDGISDDTDEIRRACEDVAGSGKVLLVPEGRFRHGPIIIDKVGQIAIEGVESPIVGPGYDPVYGPKRSIFIYAGTGDGFTFRNNTTTNNYFTYRLRLRKLGFSADASLGTVNSLISVKNIQECNFEDTEFMQAGGTTVTSAFYGNGVGLSNFNKCGFNGHNAGIEFANLPDGPLGSGEGSGANNISQCKFFDNNKGIILGYMLQTNISDNFFEANTADIFADNINRAIEVHGLVIENNTSLNGSPARTQSRFLLVKNTTNANAIRFHATVNKNWVYWGLGTHNQAVEIQSLGNTGAVDVNVEVKNNWFYRVANGGILSDDVRQNIIAERNDVRNDINGTFLPQLTGANEGRSTPLGQSTGTSIMAPVGTSESVLKTFHLPANPGLNAHFHLNAVLSAVVGSENAKIIRVRLGGITGAIVLEYNFAQGSSTIGYVDARFTNRNSHSSQVAHSTAQNSSGVAGQWFASSSVNMTISQQLVLTVQKAVDSESVFLEAANLRYQQA
jgi:hypothetical protein